MTMTAKHNSILKNLTATERGILADTLWALRYRGVGLSTVRMGKRDLNALSKLAAKGILKVKADRFGIARATLA